MRINKYLSDCGVASRRKVEELIRQGRISINENVIYELSTKVNSERDIVKVDGEPVSNKKRVYYLLNKPKGVITTTKDEKGRTTVTDLIKNETAIYPVGRLDFNTTGVLLLTNDGDFSYLLTHPKHKVPREYDVKLDKPLTEDDKLILLSGISLDSKKSKFESIVFTSKKNRFLLRVKCFEGRNHFVKRMFQTLGYTVLSLNRYNFAGIIADIPIGRYRKLSYSEINRIKVRYALQNI
ncbi:MAG: rRNA pseudouridine synthase [Ignavibacteriaceae bacterium]|nr:rRNA pseudouridine synthase [Ignavibacteriaceae bacterium]